MRILNLYAGIGGNRKLWGDEYEIVAVENNNEIAEIYQDFFPNDKVVIGDAHEYLLENFASFDFIWTSPPCQSHSRIRYGLGVKNRNTKPIYPDMKLYEEILFLAYYSNTKWVVENTKAFYKPLIHPQEIGSHFIWSNFLIPEFKISSRGHRRGTVDSLQEVKQFDISKYEITNKRQILRNCVEPEFGRHILKYALNPISKQIEFFN